MHIFCPYLKKRSYVHSYMPAQQDWLKKMKNCGRLQHFSGPSLFSTVRQAWSTTIARTNTGVLMFHFIVRQLSLFHCSGHSNRLAFPSGRNHWCGLCFRDAGSHVCYIYLAPSFINSLSSIRSTKNTAKPGHRMQHVDRKGVCGQQGRLANSAFYHTIIIHVWDDSEILVT